MTAEAFSSSFHKLNSDKPNRSFIFRLSWLVANFLNNRFTGYRIDPRLELATFRYSKEELNHYWHILPKSTPSRILCDLFWIKVPWEKLQQELGSLHILDVGCGSGYYLNRLQTYSGQTFRYTGLDVYRHHDWARLQAQSANINFHLIENNFEALVQKEVDQGANLIMSVTAIEHIDDDIAYFQAINRCLSKAKQRVVQIHIFPSAECLYYYLWHSIRQYTPRTVSKLTRVFDDQYRFRLYALAGHNTHRYFVKAALRYRMRRYLRLEKERRLKKVLERDHMVTLKETLAKDANSNSGPALFYALVLAPRSLNVVFDNNQV